MAILADKLLSSCSVLSPPGGRGHGFGLACITIGPEEGQVDHGVLVDQGGSDDPGALVAVVPAAADGDESFLPGQTDLP